MKGITGLLCTITLYACLNAGTVDAFSVLSPPSVLTRTKEESPSNFNLIEEAQKKLNEIRLSAAAFSVLSPPCVLTRTKEESSSNLNFIEEAQNKFNEIRLSNYQKKGTKIASSFIPKKYESHPLFSNQHFQTIFGVFIRDAPGCAYVKKSNIISEVLPVAKAVVEAKIGRASCRERVC